MSVSTRSDMAVMLALHNRLLRERARHYLDDAATDDEVEDSVERTVRWLLAIENPSLDHGLRYATKALRNECERTMRRRSEVVEEVPSDRRLGPLIGPKAWALERLAPRARRTMVWAAQGWSTAQIAEADNSTPEAVRFRLYYARKRMKKWLAEHEGSASALLLVVPHRVRGFFNRRVASGAAEGLAAPFTIAAASLAPLVALSFFGAGEQALPARPAQAAQPYALLQSAPPTNLAQAQPTATSEASPALLAGHSSVLAAGPGQQPSILASLPLGGAAAVPFDMQLTAVATLPGTQSSVIVAIGVDHRCGCPALTQSLDGGTTWETSPAAPPPDVTQLALPPNYPADPRIFAGVDPVAGRAPYQAAAFDKPFTPLTGLPPGQVAVSAHLEDGDPRLFSAALTGVWSTNPNGAAPYPPHEEIDYSSGSAVQNVIGAIATPTPTLGGPALLAWAPALAAVPGSATQPSLNSAMVRCPVAAPCVTVSTMSLSPGALVTTASALVAYKGNSAFISHDLGASFAQLLLPDEAHVVTVQSVALVGTSLLPWVTMTSSDGATGVFRQDAHGSWSDVSNGERLLHTHRGALVAIDRGRVLDALVDAGYRCTAADVLRWLPRCP
ncbi:MAG TPA: hypothetical protein VN193_15245 [Candidatus Angelobacter sp.]|nr:hypothetical protein [Candidatus Angelobacter sp.]